MSMSTKTRKPDYVITAPLSADGSASIEVPVWMPDRNTIFFFQAQTDLSTAEDILWENCVVDPAQREGHKDNDNVYYGVVEAIAKLILNRTSETAQVVQGNIVFDSGKSVTFKSPDRKQKGMYRSQAASDRKRAAIELLKSAFTKEDMAWIEDNDSRFYQALNALLSCFTRANFEIKNA